MTTPAESLFTALTGLASGGVWAGVAAEGTVAPYIVYQNIANPTRNTLNGASNLQNNRTQIDCFATSYSAAATLARAIDTTLAAVGSMYIKINDQGPMYEPDTKLYRVLLEYSIWATDEA
jgi:hypothetical protein